MQRDEEWRRIRAGKITGSKAPALMLKTRQGKPTAKRADLVASLVAERFSGQEFEQIDSMVLRRGRETEDEAVGAYSFATGQMVTSVDFVVYDGLPHVGCSPDGLIGDDGLVEAKCPFNATKHLDALRFGLQAEEYFWQVQQQMLVTGRAWCDVISYDPRFPENLRLATKRVERDADAIKELIAAIISVNREVDEIVSELRSAYNG